MDQLHLYIYVSNYCIYRAKGDSRFFEKVSRKNSFALILLMVFIKLVRVKSICLKEIVFLCPEKSKAETKWTVSGVSTAVRQNIIRTKAVQQVFPWIVLWSSGILRRTPVGKGSDSVLVAAVAHSTIAQLESQCCQEPAPSLQLSCVHNLRVLSSPL